MYHTITTTRHSHLTMKRERQDSCFARASSPQQMNTVATVVVLWIFGWLASTPAALAFVTPQRNHVDRLFVPCTRKYNRFHAHSQSYFGCHPRRVGSASRLARTASLLDNTPDACSRSSSTSYLSTATNTAVAFLKGLLRDTAADASPTSTSSQHSWSSYCRDDIQFTHASFGAPWHGVDKVERQWRLLQNASSTLSKFNIISVVSKSQKVAIRFSWNNMRGVAVVTLDDTQHVQKVFWVNETSNKAGPKGLKLLRAAAKVIQFTSFNPAEQIKATNNVASASLNESLPAPLAYFGAWNRRDIGAALNAFTNDVTYDDTAFPVPFRGKEKLEAHLMTCADCFPDTFSFEVDDYIGNETHWCVQWHVENNGETLPYTQGCSFYQLNNQGLIEDGIDFVEPSGPIKPGAIQLWRDTVAAQLQQEPVRLIPLVTWLAYIGIVFFSDGILPGANALALEQRTWEEVLNLSLNFFFVSPLLGLPFAPVVHPMLEGVFNGLLAWAALFSGFFTDDRRDKPNLFPMVPAIIGMQFLTSAFFLPYLSFRSTEKSTVVLGPEDIEDNFPASIGENRVIPAVLGSVGAFSIFWAVMGRTEEFGGFPERLTSFAKLLSIDRVGSSFIVDLAIFALFQGWMVEDDSSRRGGVSPLLKNAAKYIPFFGLVAYLAFRPRLSKKQNESAAVAYQEVPLGGALVEGFQEENLAKEAPRSSPPWHQHSVSEVYLHHTAIRTRNITTAIQFYSLLGFNVDCQFRAGPARAAWLSLSPSNNTASTTAAQLEIIEVPAYLLNEPEGMRRRAPDLIENAQELGYNHMAMDVTAQIQKNGLADLSVWLDQLNDKSRQQFGRNLRIAVPPRQQLIGQYVYELAFIYDADGSIVELLHKQGQVPQSIESGWEPWNGEGFVGN